MSYYIYYCETCDIDLKRKEPMMSEHQPIDCPFCGNKTYRIYSFNKKIPAHYGGAATNKLTNRGNPSKRNKKEVYVD